MNSTRHLHMLSGLVLAFQLGTATSAISSESPAQETRYQAKLFELIETDEAKYDAAFAKIFAGMLAPYVKEQRNFRKRITSGAASDSNKVQSDGRSYLHYGICQAHQCDNTTMDVLFDPVRKKMVAKVLDRCVLRWLGNPDATEQALLDVQHRMHFPATAKRCGGAK